VIYTCSRLGRPTSIAAETQITPAETYRYRWEKKCKYAAVSRKLLNDSRAMDPAASVQPPSPKVMQRSALRTPAEAAPKSHPKILHAATSEISALLRNPARNRLNSIAKGGRFAASSIRTWGTTARSRRSSGCHTAPCVERC
jgi:hypothetical protein